MFRFAIASNCLPDPGDPMMFMYLWIYIYILILICIVLILCSPLRVVLGDLPSDKAQTTPHNGAEEELAVYKKKGGRNVRFAWNSTLNRKEEPAKKTGGTSKHKSGRGKGQNVVRTIYMPNESVDVLKLIIRSLRTQLDEQAALAQQRCQALLEDRLIREAEAKEREETQRAQIKDVSKKLSEAQQNIRTVTKDFLELKHTAQSRERNLKERASEANLQNQALKKKMQTLSKRAKKSENKIKEETDNYVDHFRTQTITKEEDLAVIKAQYNATQELYEKRIKYLEGRLTTLKGKYSVLERRRNLEVEGFINDFKFARGKIRNMQKLMMRLKLGLQAVLDNTIQDMLEQENETHVHAHAHAHTRAGMGSTSANTTINTTNNHSYSSHNSSLQTEGVSRARRSRHNTSTATGHNTSTRTGKRVSKQHNTTTGSSSGSKQRRAQQERNRQLLQDLASKFQIAEEDVKAIKQHLTRVADRLDTATA